MRKVLSVIFWLLTVWAFFIEVFYLYSLGGFFGIVIGIFAFPIIMLAMPFYICFRFGNFSPLILTIIGFIGIYFCSNDNDKSTINHNIIEDYDDFQ